MQKPKSTYEGTPLRSLLAKGTVFGKKGPKPRPLAVTRSFDPTLEKREQKQLR